MENTVNSHSFLETHLCSIFSYVDDVGLNQLSLNILLSDLCVLNTLNAKLPEPCNSKLTKFLLRTITKWQTVRSLYVSNFKEILSLSTLIMNLQERDGKRGILESLLTAKVDEIQLFLSDSKLDEEESRILLCCHLEMIDAILKYIGVHDLTEAVTEEMKYKLGELIVYFLLKEDVLSLSYTLPLFSVYLRVLNNWALFQCAFNTIMNRALSDDSYAKVYIMILSFFIDSSIEDESLTDLLNTEKFWTVLKKCYTNGLCERRHLNHVLKFSTSSLCQETIEGIWKSLNGNEFKLWWKKYFVVAETLEEKQTHLVLPVFSSISDLLRDPIAQIDVIWVLFLFQSALGHDSRTIRVKAFWCLFRIRTDLYQDIHYSVLLKLFLNAVNDSTLFRKLLKTNEFVEYENELIMWVNRFVASGSKCFFEALFSEFCAVKWSPVPLYYILNFFLRCNIRRTLDCEVVLKLKGTILDVTRFHNVFIRAAIQCSFIRFVTMICECKLEKLTYVFDFTHFLNDEECLLRGVRAWSILVEYLSSTVSFHLIEKSVSEKMALLIECDERSLTKVVFPLARDILLIHDTFTKLNRNSFICNRIEIMIKSFSIALQNAYASTRVQDNYLALIARLYEMVRNESKIENSCIQSPNFVVSVEENSVFIFSYIIQRMMKSENDSELLDLYESYLVKLNGSVRTFLKLKNSASLLNEWWNKSISISGTRRDQSTYCYSKILLWICNILDENSRLWPIKNIKDIITVVVNFIYEGKPIKESTCGTSKMVSNYTITMWSIFERALKLDSLKFFKSIELSVAINFILDTFECVRKENLFFVLKTLKLFLSNETVLKSDKMVLQLIDDSWKRVEEIRSTPYYNDCLKYWIRAFFQTSLIQMQVYQDKVEQYANKFLGMAAESGGQSFRYIILVLDEFDGVKNLFQVFPRSCDILINMFCVTHADRKDQRMEYRAEEHIRMKQDEVSVNQIKKLESDYSAEVMRMKTLNIILKLNQIEADFIPISLEFIQSLTNVNQNSRKRYFNDSIIHRVKHKKLQLLLIVETILFHRISILRLNSLQLPNLLYNFAVNCLLTQPHQPSVRYMLEWLLIRLILHYPSNFGEKFWCSFSEASEERIGSICSFISVAFHVSNVSRNEIFVNQAVESILPWTMGQHFNARLYAQTVLVKLINISAKLKEKYEAVETSLNSCLKRGNAVKNSLKLQQDFYFCTFHPVNHFSILMILWDLPRLSGICREEWLPRNLYDQYLRIESDCEIPLYHEPDSFSSLTSSSWIAKVASTSHCDDNEIISDNEASHFSLSETQKKFIPTETVVNVEISSIPRNNNQQLIVVASLIDRAPNLGGLTRTCEIFAVSQLVVNNLDIIRHKEFTSLSITAEKHVDVIEVKRQNLFDYLKKLKEEGFLIVGAEQTTNSRDLRKFEFPSKSAVVLGNEREGIPASLLPVLDVCVEIPQSGVIRSLNVHVSASLFIWEYAKQRLFESS